MRKRDKHSDFARTPLPQELPLCVRQVGDFSVLQDGQSSAFSFREPEETSALPRLKYATDSPYWAEMHHDLFYGINDNAALCDKWFLACYVAMRRRGHWGVSVPLEQHLADDEAFVCSELWPPPGPASIQ